MLTNKKIDGARGKDKPYKLTDSQGLYIMILPTGVKSWRVDYVDGKRKTKVLGRYPTVGLAEARMLNLELKAFVAKGGESINIPTFDDVKRKWYLNKLPKLKNIKHKQQICYRLDTFASPYIGHLPINAIRRVNLVDVVQRVQEGGIVETAHRVAMHMRQVFDHAIDLGVLENHPAVGLSRVLNPPKRGRMSCVPMSEAKTLLQAINNFESPVTKLGLLLVAHTFVRTTELRYMRWSEIKDKTFWVIPSERMKMGKPHVVPLSKQVLDILDSLRDINGDYEFVLQSSYKGDRPISENTLLDGLYSLGYRHKMTVHGFRSLASTVLNEKSGFSHDIIERQLSHKERDAVRAAYNRAEYLDERVKMMDWYSDWIDSLLA